MKEYISMRATTDSTGYAHPEQVRLPDGKEYKINEIKEYRPADYYGFGSYGRCDCYIVEICGQIKHIFYEPVDSRFGGRYGRWFILTDESV